MVRSPASCSSASSVLPAGLALLALALLSPGAHAQQGQTVKIAWIDPLSGLMAPVGQNQVNSFRFFAEKFSGAGNPAEIGRAHV